MAATNSTRWFFSDWLSDPGVHSSSLAARGLWSDLLALMGSNKDRQYGYLMINNKIPSADTIAKLVGASVEEVTDCLAELEEKGVFSRTRNGCLYCRRMVRTQKKRENGKLGGNPNLLKDKADQGQLNQTPNLHNLNLNLNQVSKKESKKEESTALFSKAPDDEAKRTPEKARRGTRLEPNWTPDQRDWLFAIGLLGEKGSWEALEEFRDYWIGVPGQRGCKLDWNATFRNRCRTVKGRNGHGYGPRGARQPTPRERTVTALQQLRGEGFRELTDFGLPQLDHKRS